MWTPPTSTPRAAWSRTGGETIAHFESYGVVGTPIGWYDDNVVQVVEELDGPAVSPQKFLSQLSG